MDEGEGRAECANNLAVADTGFWGWTAGREAGAVSCIAEMLSCSYRYILALCSTADALYYILCSHLGCLCRKRLCDISVTTEHLACLL